MLLYMPILLLAHILLRYWQTSGKSGYSPFYFFTERYFRPRTAGLFNVRSIFRSPYFSSPAALSKHRVMLECHSAQTGLAQTT